MTQEEKAKAYDEALEKAKKALKTDIHESGMWAIQRIFPQLCESEDERIRKGLIEYFEGFRMGNAEVKWEGLNVQEVLVWLEKQKEQKPAEWSEEDEKMLHTIIADFKGFCHNNTSTLEPHFNECIAWLKSLPERFNLQSKQEQNDYITPHKEFFKFIYDRLINVHKENPNVDYMRSFKERLNNLSFGEKQEWSEEDEIYLQDALWCVEKAEKSCKDEQDKGACWSAKRWLKSLCPQPHWKPSKHQMTILKAVKDYVGKGSGYWGEALGSLIDDLEKL